MSFKRRRLLIALSLLLVALASGVLFLRRGRTPERHEIVTQEPGQERHVWRSFRASWTFLPGYPEGPLSLDTLLLHQNRLYYAGSYEVGCVDKVSGNLLWQHRFVARKALENNRSMSDSTWHLLADAHFLYACNSPQDNTMPPRLCVLDLQTGEVAWERLLTRESQSSPCLAGAFLLVPNVNGTVTAFQVRDGAIVWERKLTQTAYDPQGNTPKLRLHAAGSIAVARIGSGRLVGFRPEEGKALWSYQRSDQSTEDAEGGEPCEFAVRNGIVYALADGRQVAVQAATGKVLWKRPLGNESDEASDVLLWKNSVLTFPANLFTALRPADGATLWHDGSARYEDLSSGQTAGLLVTSQHGGVSDSIFVTMHTSPLLGGRVRPLLSVSDLDTLVALDPANGKEQWRWQAEAGCPINQLTPDGPRFYFTDNTRLFAMEEGAPDPLPTGPEERRSLALRMITALFHWPKKPPTFLDRLGSKVPTVAAHLPRETLETIDSQEASLTLLRLKQDSVPALMDYVEHEIDDPGRNIMFGTFSAQDQELTLALKLLVDLDARTQIPTLIHHLENAKDPLSHTPIADALVQFGDWSALPALFRYVQTDADEVGNGESALYFVCRYAPVTALPHSSMPTQAQVTAYLLARLKDPKAPLWLRQFARFELLNNRGEAARQAALATFPQERTARYLPVNLVLQKFNSAQKASGIYPVGFPLDFESEAVCRDAQGRWWAAFYCSYLGKYSHIWFVQSIDKIHWVKPTFGCDLPEYDNNSPLEFLHLSCREGRFRLEWPEEFDEATRQRTHLRSKEIAISTLYQDSDGDGLTDLVEKELGTNPLLADSNNNGLPDGQDKNPLWRPHSLTEEEAIYQAVVEALCQYGRGIPPKAGVAPAATGALRIAVSTSSQTGVTFLNQELFAPFGSDGRPLRPMLPPGSTGIEIRGYSGMVIPHPFQPERDLWKNRDDIFGQFIRPRIGLDGLQPNRQKQDARTPSLQTDPFAPASLSPTAKKGDFHEYFPCERSPDGRRVRIGWTQENWNEETGFDIEVDKIEGRWVPVECRRLARNSRYNRTTVTPLQPVRPYRGIK